MRQPAAKRGDLITAMDTHLVKFPMPPAPVPTPLPFRGTLDNNLSATVRIEGKPAATVDSTATNTPPHIPPPGATFLRPPANRGTVSTGSTTVRINQRAAARNGDRGTTCNDLQLPNTGTVVVTRSTVWIGG